jgi:hypothetical protein
MKICLLTANLGGFENVKEHVPQSIEYDLHRFTDENFPPRSCTLTPRMQARLAKMFGWQMVPGYDIYIWVDSSCIFPHPDSLKWFIEQLDGYDLVTFKHPDRNTIKQEADYLNKRILMGCSYITPRYKNELTEAQLTEIFEDKDYVDDKLYASTVMVYRPSDQVRKMMKEWWYHTSRYHSDEQLSLPYVTRNLKVRVIPERYSSMKYLTHVRK